MKKIKPIDIDLHLKYLCPNCGAICWLSLRESKTVGYINVCDICHDTFKVKTIHKITIQYKNNKSVGKAIEKNQKTSIIFDPDTRLKSISSLVGYGFTQKEASELVDDTFDIFKTNDIGILVKESLKLFGAKNG
jgi:hypothetical protein